MDTTCKHWLDHGGTLDLFFWSGDNFENQNDNFPIVKVVNFKKKNGHGTAKCLKI